MKPSSFRRSLALALPAAAGLALAIALLAAATAAATPPLRLRTSTPTHAFAEWGVTTAITGRVTDAQSGLPIPLVGVSAFDAVADSAVNAVLTDPSGYYTLPVTAPYGAVKLQFTAGQPYAVEWWNDQMSMADALPISLTSGAVLGGLDLALDRAGVISLTVNVGGAPLRAGTSLNVEAFNAAGSFVGNLVRDGRYFYIWLRPGAYRLRWAGDQSVPGWHGGSSFATAAPVTLTANTTTTLSLDLAPGGVITGLITDALSGQPLPSANVDVFDAAGFHLPAPSYAYADATGVYTAGGLSTGTYFLRFAHPTHATQFSGGAASLAGAAGLTVTAGQTRTSVNAPLAPLAVLTGTLTRAGAVIPNPGAVQISAYRPGTDEVVAYGFNDGGGLYTLGVPSGTVQLRFTGLGYVPEWYDNQPIQAVAAAITASAGMTRTNLNADLAPADGCVGGTLSALTGTVAGAYVHLFDSTGTRASLASSDPGGAYLMCGLAPGQYHARFGLYPFAIEWHANQPSAATADLVVVQAGLTTQVDAVFENLGGCLRGVLRGPSGLAETGLYHKVAALDRFGRLQAAYSLYAHVMETSLQPDLTGRFALCGLPPGPYTLLGWMDFDYDGRLDSGEPFDAAAATLAGAAFPAEVELSIPAPKLFVPWVGR